MRTMYDQTSERTSGKIVYLNEYRVRKEREQSRAEYTRSSRPTFPVCRGDLLNLGMVVMILAGTGMILSGL